MAKQNFVLDGETAISSVPFSWNSSWDDGWMGYISLWNRNAAGPHTANFRMTGSDWTIHTLRLAGEGGIQANFTDSGSGSGREIRALHLSEAGSDITLRVTEVRNIFGQEGNDVLNLLGTGANYVNLESGNNTIRATGQDGITTLLVDEGRNRITLEDDARILLLKMDRGTNSLTTENGNVESIYSYNGTNTLNIGNGGVQQIVFGGDAVTHNITSRGFLGSVQVYGDSATNLALVGDTGAETVNLGNGADRVTTDDGYVTLINTRGGDDRVTLGGGGTGFVRTGDGDDLISVTAFNPNFGVHIQGGSGTNTVDLSRMGGPLTVDLDLYGEWQDVASGRGYVGFTEINRLIGGRQADTFTGNGDANTFTGAKGNDILTGEAGADVFIMLKKAGRDTITDFAAGEDVIDFAGASRLSRLNFAQEGDDVLVRFGTSSVIVEDITVADLRTDDNFGF